MAGTWSGGRAGQGMLPRTRQADADAALELQWQRCIMSVVSRTWTPRTPAWHMFAGADHKEEEWGGGWLNLLTPPTIMGRAAHNGARFGCVWARFRTLHQCEVFSDAGLRGILPSKNTLQCSGDPLPDVWGSFPPHRGVVFPSRSLRNYWRPRWVWGARWAASPLGHGAVAGRLSSHSGTHLMSACVPPTLPSPIPQLARAPVRLGSVGRAPSLKGATKPDDFFE